MIVDEVINYGDSILAIGQTHGLPLRARMAGGDHSLLARGSKLTLTWAPTDAHVLPRG